MSVRAVANNKTNPILVEIAGITKADLTEHEARTLRDDLNRLLGEVSARGRLVNEVLAAARQWARVYHAPMYLTSFDSSYARSRLDNAVYQLCASEPVHANPSAYTKSVLP